MEHHTHPVRSISNAKPYHAHLDHLGGQNIAAGHLDPADCAPQTSSAQPQPNHAKNPVIKIILRLHSFLVRAPNPLSPASEASESGNLSESFPSLISHHTV